ncbi:MAG: hypothetical protein E7157_02045 [Lactobacillales bacterium]|nr:hypothetical protein [Lactobacillales bacterium]
MEKSILQRNYSSETRKTLDYLLKVIDMQLKEIFESLKYFNTNKDLRYESCIESLQNSTEINQITEMFKLYGLITDEEQKRLEFIKQSIYVQAYTDFYVMNRLLNKIKKEDPDFQKTTYEIIEKQYFNEPSIYVVMLKCMEEFKNLSAYNKIIAMKNLTPKEDKMLKSINPFYEYERNLYDVEITKELIMRQIDKWKKNFDLEKSLHETINFIFNLYKLNPNNIKNLFEELSLDQILNSQSEEESILFNNTYITREILNNKLEEEYNAKEKVKK